MIENISNKFEKVNGKYLRGSGGLKDNSTCFSVCFYKFCLTSIEYLIEMRTVLKEKAFMKRVVKSQQDVDLFKETSF